jgi:D-sedoheptulose 7-phosphate isomerase
MHVLTSSIKIRITGISGNERSEKKYMDYPTKHESMVLEPTIGTIDYHEAIVSALNCHRTLLDGALAQLATRTTVFTEAAARLIETLRTGHKVLVAGNGGSAAEAQHFAAELVGRFKRERSPYAVLALTTDTSILTAVANDYGYQDVFARQVLALGQPADMLIAFSTSGDSENLVRAAATAQRCLMTVIAVTGDRPNRLECMADPAIRVPGVDTAIIQELHMVVTHILCDLVESELAACERGAGR